MASFRNRNHCSFSRSCCLVIQKNLEAPAPLLIPLGARYWISSTLEQRQNALGYLCPTYQGMVKIKCLCKVQWPRICCLEVRLCKARSKSQHAPSWDVHFLLPIVSLRNWVGRTGMRTRHENHDALFCVCVLTRVSNLEILGEGL